MQPDDARAAIAAEMRAEMARQGKTQRELGAVLKLDQPSISLRLRGERSFKAEEIAVAAAWLGVPVAQFVPVTSERVA